MQHFILIVLVSIHIAHCLSDVRTSLGIRYKRDISTTSDISSWKIGVVNEISLMKCIYSCMLAESCFWSTFNSGTCELLSISRNDVDNILSITNNGGLPTYQMLRGCSKQTCREVDVCFFVQVSNSCIKYYVDELEYACAKTICKRDGGELLRIDSQSKQDTMVTVLSIFNSNFLDVNHDLTVQGTKNDADKWVFDDGTHMSYFNWNNNDGQPSNGTDEQYIYIRSIYNWQWHDFGPALRPFLCEIHA